MFKIVRGERNFSPDTPFLFITFCSISWCFMVKYSEYSRSAFFSQAHSPLLNNNITDHAYSEVSYPMPQLLALPKRGLLTHTYYQEQKQYPQKIPESWTECCNRRWRTGMVQEPHLQNACYREPKLGGFSVVTKNRSQAGIQLTVWEILF